MRFTDCYYRYRGRDIVQDVFIETGTYQGESLALAVGAGFSEMHSVEVFRDNFEAARVKFVGDARVHVHLGSSPEVLLRIMDGRRATTFWLDAHFQGVTFAEQDVRFGQCPLVAELGAIWSVRLDVLPFVLIDDAHIFCRSRVVPSVFNLDEWPTLGQIVELFPSNYQVEVFEDVIFCLPVRKIF